MMHYAYVTFAMFNSSFPRSEKANVIQLGFLMNLGGFSDSMNKFPMTFVRKIVDALAVQMDDSIDPQLLISLLVY